MLRALLFLVCLLALPVGAEELVSVCYGYGCLTFAEIRYSEGQLGGTRRLLATARSAADERHVLAVAIGRLYAWAGEQSPVHNDRGGNVEDGEVSGRMDCIDHSTSTTRLLRVLEARGYLRWHRVLEPASRDFLGLFTAHWSAVIEEKADGDAERAPARFVVDSWFVDNGQPAVILPLEDWKKGAGPDV